MTSSCLHTSDKGVFKRNYEQSEYRKEEGEKKKKRKTTNSQLILNALLFDNVVPFRANS